MTNKLLYVISLTALVISCTREEKNSSFVTIQLPEAVQQSKSSNNSYTDDGGYYDEDSKWSPTIPTGISTGDAPINCYGIMVSGPEAFMSENTCGRKSTISNSDGIAYVEGAEYNFKLGLWAAAVPSGGTLEIEVPAGNDRIFRLIGFHAADPSACVNLKSGETDNSNLTKPYVISKSAKMSLAPGATVTVPMVMSFNSNHWFDECRGPGFNFDDHQSSIVATGLNIKKPTFDPSVLIGNSTCQAVDIVSVDDLGRMGRFPATWANYTAGIQQTVPAPSTYMISYSNPLDCDSSTGGLPAFTVNNSSSRTRRWIKHSHATATNISLRANVTAVNGSSEGVSLPMGTAKGFTSRNYDEGTFEIIGPKRVVKGNKYKFQIVPRRYDGSIFGSNGSPVASINVALSTPAGAVPSDLLDANCTSTLSTALTVDAVSNKFPEFCIDVDSDFATEESLAFTSALTGFDINTPTVLHTKTFSFLNSGGGQNYFHHIGVVGPGSTPGTVGCYGPFTVSLENETGAHVPNTSAAALSLAITNSNSTNILHHLKPDCADAGYTSPFTLSYATGESSKTFYVGITAAISPPTSRTFFINHATTGLTNEFTFSIDP